MFYHSRPRLLTGKHSLIVVMQTRTDAFFSNSYRSSKSPAHSPRGGSASAPFRVYDRKGSQPDISHAPPQSGSKSVRGRGVPLDINYGRKVSQREKFNEQRHIRVAQEHKPGRVLLAASPSLVNEAAMKMYRQNDSMNGPSPIRMPTLNTSPSIQSTTAKEKLINNGLDRDRVELDGTGTKLGKQTTKQNVTLHKRGVLGEPSFINIDRKRLLRGYTSAASRCKSLKSDLKELRRSVVSECRSTASFIENSMSEITKEAAIYENDRIRLRQHLLKLERANTLLMRELIQTKESLADVKSERDVLIDELKVCEKLGGAPIHALKARGQELAAMRARAILVNTREREKRRKNLKFYDEKQQNSSNNVEAEARGAKDAQSNKKVENKNSGELDQSATQDDGIKELFHRCINNSLLLIQIEDDEFNQLLKHLSHAKGRNAFAYALYAHKLPDNEPPKSISESAFEMIAYLMKECLDQCSSAVPPDYRVAQMLMSMEMSFCMPGEVGSNKFIFLKQRMSKSRIWKNVTFWEEAFFSAIENVRLKSKADALAFPDLTPSEQKKFIEREQSQVLELIRLFKTRMENSGVLRNEMNALLVRLCQIHDIKEDQVLPPRVAFSQVENYTIDLHDSPDIASI